MLTLFLAANLFLMSDRGHFWNADKISKITEISWDQSSSSVDMEILKGKRILVLVHGFNNTANDALSTYRTVNAQISQLKDGKGNSFYDIVVGYLWPGYDEKAEYYLAKDNARKLSSKMRGHIALFNTYAKEMDIMAHSLGNYLIYEALDVSLPGNNDKKMVRNLYSVAPAVNEDSIEKGEKYYTSTQNCEKVFVFHSKQDDVLRFLYTLSEFNIALGYEGVRKLKKLPANVQLVDCSSFATGHSAYFAAKGMYDFIRSELDKEEIE